MKEKNLYSLEKVFNASSLLSKEMNFIHFISIIVEQSIDISKSDLSCFYLNIKPKDNNGVLKLINKKGWFEVPDKFSENNELISFIKECNEAVLLLERKKSPFIDLLLNPKMQSGMAIPISIPNFFVGILFLNSANDNFYNNEKFYFLDSFSKLCKGMLHNTKLLQEFKDYIKEMKKLYT